MIQTNATLLGWLDKAIALGGPYDPAALFIGVATAIEDLGPDTLMVNVTEATGAMATRQALTPWGTPYKLADGRWCVDSKLITFKPLDATENQTINWYFLASAAVAGNLKGFKRVFPGVTLLDQNGHLNFVIRLTIDPLGRFDQDVVFNG